MARITKQQLERFKELYQASFGISLNDSDALEQATRLIELVARVRRTAGAKNG